MDIKLLPKILCLDEGKDVIKFIEGVLTKTYGNCLTDGDNYMLFQNPRSTSLLQAHIDTVKRETKYEIFQRNGVIFANNSVLGADDRAGVWAITKLVQTCVEGKIEPPNVLFTNYEESGSGGMKEFVKQKIDFKHVNMAIAMDRKGCGHYVTYNHLAKEVERYMYTFGWDDQNGSFSDISIFTDEYLIPSVNVAVGYHREHTKNETLNLDELFLTVNRVYKMLKNPIKQLYPSKKKYSYAQNWGADGYYSNYWNNKEIPGEVKNYSSARYKSTCDFCATVGWVNYIITTKNRLCDNCYDDWVLTLSKG